MIIMCRDVSCRDYDPIVLLCANQVTFHADYDEAVLLAKKNNVPLKVIYACVVEGGRVGGGVGGRMGGRVVRMGFSLKESS